MEPNERSKDKGLTIDRDAQISVVVNTPDSEEETIDLGRVFHNMKVKSRVYAWVLVLCLLIGICAPLLLYQFSKPDLTVASVVTLKYQAPVYKTNTIVNPVTGAVTTTKELALDDDGEIIYGQVQSLVAPDGEDLDVNLITSSYVLQRALNGMDLSKPVSLSALRSNISIERVLTEDSQRIQALAAQMITDKNSAAYDQLLNMELEYTPMITVRLTNGFGEEDSRNKIYLNDSELQQLLDRILTEYNNYLAMTYSDQKLPGDEISDIETAENPELLESLEKLQTAMDNLYDYCDQKPDDIKAYRSHTNGRNLTDWMEAIKAVRETSVNSLYSHASHDFIIQDRDALLSNYQFQLQNTQTELDALNEKITATQSILDNYKNDQIYVSMQENDTYKTTQTTTAYYDKLVLQQVEYYQEQADLEKTIADLNRKIDHLKSGSAVSAENNSEVSTEELQKAITACREVYNGVLAHMTELINSTFYNTYTEHTVPQGKVPSFITANLKKMLIGGAVGIVLACGLWFLAALAPEFRRNRKDDEDGKEAAEA